MRTVFSIRFIAAIGALLGLFAVVLVIADGRSSNEGVAAPATSVISGVQADGSLARQIDFIETIAATSSSDVDVDVVVDGFAATTLDLGIDSTRTLRIVEGTPGEQHCSEGRLEAACAVVADLLGESVVWFALVPADGSRTVALPAIDELVDGRAILVNGWSVDYAPILDRRCPDDGDPSTLDEFASYSEFREVLGVDFVANYDLDERRLTSVTCRQQVDWFDATTRED